MFFFLKDKYKGHRAIRFLQFKDSRITNGFPLKVDPCHNSTSTQSVISPAEIHFQWRCFCSVELSLSVPGLCRLGEVGARCPRPSPAEGGGRRGGQLPGAPPSCPAGLNRRFSCVWVLQHSVTLRVYVLCSPILSVTGSPVTGRPGSVSVTDLSGARPVTHFTARVYERDPSPRT